MVLSDSTGARQLGQTTHLGGRLMETLERMAHHPIVRAGATVGLVGFWFWLEMGLRRRRLETWIS
jgi:hypothetical protein